VFILRTLLADAQGDRQAAFESLATALAQAETEDVIRPFLDEGEPMAALLADLRVAARGSRRPAAGASPAGASPALVTGRPGGALRAAGPAPQSGRDPAAGPAPGGGSEANRHLDPGRRRCSPRPPMRQDDRVGAGRRQSCPSASSCCCPG
jgi:LuxR family maltose regulon positive regulatory protein